MKYFIALVLVFVAVAAFAASGDKTPASKLKFHTISSSSKRPCTIGEQRIDKTYIYTCASSAAGAGKWKRTSTGDSF